MYCITSKVIIGICGDRVLIEDYPTYHSLDFYEEVLEEGKKFENV